MHQINIRPILASDGRGEKCHPRTDYTTASKHRYKRIYNPTKGSPAAD